MALPYSKFIEQIVKNERPEPISMSVEELNIARTFPHQKLYTLSKSRYATQDPYQQLPYHTIDHDLLLLV